MATDDRFVTIATIHDPVRAEVLKDVLSQEGIEATIAGVNHSALFGQMGAFVTIHLQVLESRAEEAAAIVLALDDEDAELVDSGEAAMMRTADHADYADPEAIHDAGPGPYREGPPKTKPPRRQSNPMTMVGVAVVLFVVFMIGVFSAF